MRLTQKQAIELASQVLHKLGCCSFIVDLAAHLRQTSEGWMFTSPKRDDLGAKLAAVVVTVSKGRNTWEGHDYQHNGNLQGSFALSHGKLSVSVQDL